MRSTEPKAIPLRKIFVRCREHIGDIVNSTAALRTIRENFPNAHITVEVGEGLSALVNDAIFCNKVVEKRRREGFSGKLRNVLWMVRERFDAVIVLDESRRLMFEAFLARARYRYGIHKGKSQSIYTDGVHHRRDIHETRGNFACLLHAMNLDVSTKLVLPVKIEHFEAAKRILRMSGANFDQPMVGIQCPDIVNRRNWPADNLLELANLLYEAGYQTLLFGGGGRLCWQRILSRDQKLRSSTRLAN